MVFESLLTYSRPQISDRREESRDSFGFVLDGRAGDVYDENAFRHFLAIERVRAERSERPVMLLLVSLRKCPKMGVVVPRALTATILSGLGQSVREVDFVGWYREGRVASAVLTQGLDAPHAAAPARIVERVTAILSRNLPVEVAERLRVRVVRLGSRVKS